LIGLWFEIIPFKIFDLRWLLSTSQV
jgi:hypothetical protein